MFLAAVLGRHAVVSRLLEDTSWLACPDSAIGHDSLHIAIMNGHSETVKVLLAHDSVMQVRRPRSYYEEAIESLARQGRGQMLRMILHETPHFRTYGHGAFSVALEAATKYRYADCVKILEERGAKSPEKGSRRDLYAFTSALTRWLSI